MKSPGPKTRLASRGLAAAISLTCSRPIASSICTSSPIRPTGRPALCSTWVSSRSSACTWAADWVLGSTRASIRAPAPLTTSITSPYVHGLSHPFTRTVTSPAAKPASRR